MNPSKFKVLTYLGNYVDASLLSKGIYFTPTPMLRALETTIESLEEIYKNASKIYDVNTCIENLKKCSLTIVELSVVK
jgi:hypothetical protein